MSQPKYVSITPAAPGVSTRMASYSSTSSDELLSVGVRGKKRRLDHLTWEEKVQRKKLKNRVAAQTSRDRKKAKMEDMEITIQELNENTEILRSRYEKLEEVNENLVLKNKELVRQVNDLKKQLDDLKAAQNGPSCKLLDCVKSETSEFDLKGSAEGKTNSLGVRNDTIQRQPLEDHSAMSALQDVFDGFDGAELEELAESLLCDILPKLETSDIQSNEVASEVESTEQQLSGSVVGSTTELLESGRNSAANSYRIIPELEQNLSTKLEADTETVYGTYDETTNSIMIVMSDGTKQLDEDAVQEIVADYGDQDLTTAHSLMDDHTYVCKQEELEDPLEEFLNISCKPSSPFFDCSSSDPGYESITTSPPHTDNFNYKDFINWDLFPNLD